MIDRRTRHLMTLPLTDSLDVSLFSTFDYDAAGGPFAFFGAAYRLYDESARLVQFVVHRPIPERDDASVLTGEFVPLGLVTRAPGLDPEPSGDEVLTDATIYQGNKTGGIPYYSQLLGDVRQTMDLLRTGYVHLIQLSGLSNTDSIVSGMWPFGESHFHVFAGRQGDVHRFQYIWA